MNNWKHKVYKRREEALASGKPIRILGIETSCDETSAAVIENGNTIRSNVISSQIESHKRFGGVVPEVASRHHVENITLIIDQALREANLTLDDIDAIAVTYGPGLVGALLVGVAAAKAISFARGIPLVGVHHIAGHIYANRFVKELEFPLLALVVSGGHTELVYMKEHGAYEIIGQTRDDAVGEAYDKVARSLGLPYPGGPHIDQLAHEGEPSIPLPRAWLEGTYDFSFSGLKSAVLNTLHNAAQRGESIEPKNLAASFQESVIEVLVDKTFRLINERPVKQLLLAGGVAANKGLRRALSERAAREGVELIIPPLSLCTDNAAMIAGAGYIEYKKGNLASMTLNGVPGLPLA
ncbi:MULTISPECIES: tRNA (adenosine(37)-N6)-threonylcarbamoyltransferase complex transferase subunit TsaD [Aneurinibacillus]|jgi:N6-L-threonylcarbamoyladenine synthase|uniref:tRNA N6-adenosine threonylcarbamoyltransferase n=1 Tax=Aneurinibacillus thermoaerophilus TaxID=143495 RepID=A0A1G8ANN7_ANETH|nr:MULTISPECIES: tRNA (adenosine(37)-N6)-threonylcarbamoyltransferase complex transferase subunit TsaD [Aneurinibacillus]AMA74243.1 tRNA threonylcarbamoyl adenosine modification protein TsaD [Aneurinibacillus sp. XH2]MED0676758.1 tRNA (adenosine(37)-N6)-threonylcarbamoyltransferase complex transferase subunit TsaD [Aneurinibacillus thermoaerophilus]MED0680970.1 tRNA (adenosine(37)-N6)-threonylcarbamoyltransferase complex transferase subunit TsaD [Aneurinibacillus thermoaerophilus]MED0738615.1 t